MGERVCTVWEGKREEKNIRIVLYCVVLGCGELIGKQIQLQIGKRKKKGWRCSCGDALSPGRAARISQREICRDLKWYEMKSERFDLLLYKIQRYINSIHYSLLLLVVLWCVALCCIWVALYTVLGCIVLYCTVAVLRCIIIIIVLYCIGLCWVVLCCGVVCWVGLGCIVSYCIVLWCIVLCCVVLNFVLYCTVLYCNVLCNVVLYCIVFLLHCNLSLSFSLLLSPPSLYLPLFLLSLSLFCLLSLFFLLSLYLPYYGFRTKLTKLQSL